VADQVVLCAILNSFTLDFYARLRVNATLNFFIFYELPVPVLNEFETVFEDLLRRGLALLCSDARFANLAKELNFDMKDAAMNDAARFRIRAEIDAIVAHVYGVNEEELRHILTSFPLVQEGVKARVLEAFLSWKPLSNDPTLRLIASGESTRLEFKASARWDLNLKQVNKTLEHVIVKTVASFMNSEGGSLLIGVADSGEILGLAPDFQTLGRQANADGFENWLTTRLLEAIDRDRIRLLRVSFQTIEGKTICRVDVDRSPRPVYIAEPGGGEKFWVRMGNSTRELSISEAHAYVDEHFNRAEASREDSTTTPAPAPPTPVGPNAKNSLTLLPQPTKKASFPTHGLFSPRAADKTEAAPPMTPHEDNAPKSDEEPDEPTSTSTRRVADEYEVDEVLLYIRDVVKGSDPIPREDAIREIATLLGAERVGSRIRDLIEGMLNSASRRFIIETRDGGLVACTRSIEDYHRDFLKTALKAVIGRTWTDEDAAIRAATRYLGFRRTGPKISKAFKSAINGLLRQNELERDGGVLRRPNQ